MKQLTSKAICFARSSGLKRKQEGSVRQSKVPNGSLTEHGEPTEVQDKERQLAKALKRAASADLGTQRRQAVRVWWAEKQGGLERIHVHGSQAWGWDKKRKSYKGRLGQEEKVQGSLVPKRTELVSQ
jgi:hypothetical protein